MAVFVYKDGNKVLIEPEFLQNHLDAGYSLTKDEPVKAKPKAKSTKRKAKSDD